MTASAYVKPEFNAPIHEHDCDCCTYLGTDRLSVELFDFYLCKGGSMPKREDTLIARYSSNPADNLSLPVECCCNKETHPLGRAREIAQYKNLI